MNICFFTVQIASYPQTVIYNETVQGTYLLFKIPNPKRGRPFYYINCIATSEYIQNLLSVYQKGDYIILRGNLLTVLSNNIYSTRINWIEDFAIRLYH